MDVLSGFKRQMVHMQAERHFKAGNFKTALEEYKRLFEMILDSGDDGLSAYYDERIADCYDKQEHQGHKDRMADHKKAAEHYVKAANRYRTMRDYEKAGLVYEKGAKAFDEFDDFTEAAEFYRESAKMFMDAGDFVNASYVFHNAADYYEKDGEYEKAAKTYRDCAVCDLKLRDTASASSSFKKAGLNYEKVKAWDKAVDSYANTIGIDSIGRQFLDIADTYSKMANCYFEQSDFKNAVYYNLRAADLRLSNNDLRGAGVSYRDAGDVFESNKDHDSAIENYHKSAKTFFSANNPSQEGASYFKAADTYQVKGEYELSGDNYLESAKSNRVAQNETLAHDAYMKAGAMYVKAASGKDDKKEAARLQMKAALAYSDVSDFDRAADAYNNHAKLLWAAGERDDAIAGWKKAAEEYVKGGRLWDAAEAYVNQEDYARGAELYDAYTAPLEEKKDHYGIGLGCLESGNCFRRLGNESMMKARLDRCVSNLFKAIDEMKAKGEGRDNTVLLGDAYRKMGEADQMLWETVRSLDHFAKAEAYYAKADEQDRLTIAKGLRLKAEAIKAIDHGYYPKAEELLIQSKGCIDQALKRGGWKKEYTRILQDNFNDAEDLIEKIKLKPEIVLEIDRYSYTFANLPIILNLNLTNNGKYTMKNVTFLEHLPDEIKLLKLPENIPEIEPTGARGTHVELTPLKTGLYMMKPIEVYYEDQKGHKYVKASNEMNLEVVERPLTDYKNYLKALEIFQKYSQTQEANENWFQAGDGYRQMAETYGRFRSDDTLRGYYNKARENYAKYAENSIKDAESQDKTLVKRLADAFWFKGDGLANTDLLEEAAAAFAQSVPLYKACRAENLANRSTAFKVKAEGIRAIKVGDYTRAESRLKESLIFFDEVIKSGGYDEEGLKFLQKNEDDARKLLGDVLSKPSLGISVTCPAEAQVGETVTVRAEITNPLDYRVAPVRPTVNSTEGLEVIDNAATLDEILPGGRGIIEFRLKVTRPGEYRFSPLDIMYTDPKNRSYMRSSGEIILRTAGYGSGGKAQEEEKPLDRPAEALQVEDVSLEIDKYSYTFADVPVILNFRLVNRGEYVIREITFLQHLPDTMRISRLPGRIAQLPPQKEKSAYIEITPSKTGVYRAKPIEVYYEDQKGSKYVKASNETSLEVIEKPPTDYKNYQSAVETFRKYAQSQEANRNWFQAGDGHRQMAETYGKFRSDATLREYHMKTVESYLRYAAENAADEGSDDPTLAKRLADAHWWAGLSLQETGEQKGASESYGKAAAIYGRCGYDNLAAKAQAMRLKADAIRSIRAGDYASAEDMLRQSLKDYAEVMKGGGYDEEGLRFLQKNEADAKSMLQNIKVAPEIQVTVECPTSADAGEAFTLKATITNPLGYALQDVRPSINAAQGLEIVQDTMPLGQIPAGGQGSLEFRLRAVKPGDYRFSPLDVSYADDKGKTYKRGCNEVSVKIQAAQEAPHARPVPDPEMGGTPSVTLDFGRGADVRAEAETVLTGVLANVGDATAATIRFIGNTTEQVEVLEAPKPQDMMKPGERREVKARVIAHAEGVIKAKLVEFFYKDPQGKRFFKSSDEISLNAKKASVQAPAPSESGLTTQADEIRKRLEAALTHFSEDKIILISSKTENHGDVVSGMLDILVRQKGMDGVYLSVTQPYEVIRDTMESAGIKAGGIYFIDCISRQSGKAQEKSETVMFVENPSSLEEISMYLDRLLSKIEAPKRFIFIDSLSSLLIYNTDKSVKEFAHYVINKMRLGNIAGVILSIEKKEAEDLVKTISPMCDSDIRL